MSIRKGISMDCTVKNDGSTVTGASSGGRKAQFWNCRLGNSCHMAKHWDYWKAGGHPTCGQLACAPVLQHMCLQTQSLLCDTKFARMSGHLFHWSRTMGKASHTQTHTHTQTHHFNGHFPDKSGLAGFPRDSESQPILIPSNPVGQAKNVHIPSNTIPPHLFCLNLNVH